MSLLAQRAAALRARCRQPGGLRAFVEAFWPIVEPAAPFLDGWHIGAVCSFLEAWYRREFSNAVLNLPPGTGKSLLVDVFFQAWVWTQEPGHKFLTCAFDLSLGLRDADKIVQILKSDLFRKAWPGCELRPDMRAKRNIWTTGGGYRFSTTPQGTGLGRHFTSVSVNDPVKAQDVLDGKVADVNVALERAQRWFDGTLQTRRADPKRFGIMVTMQRLREKDLAETCLDRGYAHLCLPMRYEPNATWIRSSGGDWSARLERRSEPGELLHPARYPEAITGELEASLGEHASAQLQQNPIPRTGGLLEEQHLRWEWVELPTSGAYWIQVWDFAAKGTSATHSAVHGALWCSAQVTQVRELLNTIDQRDRTQRAERSEVQTVTAEHRYLLVDEVWGHHTVPESEALFERVQSDARWGKAHQRIIEAKAAGIGIIQRYERKFSSVVAFHEIDDVCKKLAQQDKLDRHTSNLGEWHAGRVLLPQWKPTVNGAGPDAFRKELLAFPRGAKDDRVDTSSMALARLVQGLSLYMSQVKLLAAQSGRRR
jgi:hypothetical protein